eukprot:15449923-Alexandrium_andersonii.AAC.1
MQRLLVLSVAGPHRSQLLLPAPDVHRRHAVGLVVGRMIVHAIDGAATHAVPAAHVPEAVEDDALLLRDQAPLLAIGHGAPAAEVREAGVLEQRIRGGHLILRGDGVARAPA